MKVAGASAVELRGAGISAIGLKAEGISLAEIKAAGYSIKELKLAGFTYPSRRDQTLVQFSRHTFLACWCEFCFDFRPLLERYTVVGTDRSRCARLNSRRTS